MIKVVLYGMFLCLYLYTSAEAQVDFPIGEKCTFALSWMKIPVGHFTAEITGEKVFRGRNVYIMSFKGETNRYASFLYPVKDSFVSYVDQETLLPLRLEEQRREGFYKKDAVTLFDHAKKKAYFHNYVDGSYKTYDITEESYDIVSVFYQLRRQAIEVQKPYVCNVLFAETLFVVTGTPKAVKRIEISPGSFMDALYVEPHARVAEKLVKEGTVSTYISHDQYHIPLHIIVKAPLFTRITAVLIDSAYYHHTSTVQNKS